jgi:hypothetical protein
MTVPEFLKHRNEWTTTHTELLAKLKTLVGEDVKSSKAWTNAPSALSNRLKRVAPALHEIVIEYEDGRHSGEKRTQREQSRDEG